MNDKLKNEIEQALERHLKEWPQDTAPDIDYDLVGKLLKGRNVSFAPWSFGSLGFNHEDTREDYGLCFFDNERQNKNGFDERILFSKRRDFCSLNLIDNYPDASYTLTVFPHLYRKDNKAEVEINVWKFSGDKSVSHNNWPIGKVLIAHNIRNEEDLVVLYNKIINMGIGRFLSCSPEELYQELGIEEKRIQTIDKVDNTEVEQTVSESNDNQVVEQSSDEIKEDKVEVDNKPKYEKLSQDDAKKIQLYQSMMELNIPLSDEQKAELESLREKAEKADKLNAYREKGPERKIHQMEAMHEREVANIAKNHAWEESFAKSESKREQELKELQLMRKQAEALRGLESVEPALLNDSQKELLSNNDRFIGAQEIADKHQNEKGMNEEIRKIMAEYYQEQENKGRSK